jgi:hypothetical protein
MKTIKIDDMEITEPIKCKTYQEAVDNCPKGYRMLEIWELVKFACENNNVIFETEKGFWIFFWSSTKVKDGVLRLCRDCYGGWDALWDYLGDSGDDGRVVYFKEGGAK